MDRSTGQAVRHMRAPTVGTAASAMSPTLRAHIQNLDRAQWG
jgi:hypothetical protein